LTPSAPATPVNPTIAPVIKKRVDDTPPKRKVVDTPPRQRRPPPDEVIYERAPPPDRGPPPGAIMQGIGIGVGIGMGMGGGRGGDYHNDRGRYEDHSRDTEDRSVLRRRMEINCVCCFPIRKCCSLTD
ncbi:MAG: hypothetical protein V7632_2158, partial [Bradyrhizobium sp.]